MSDLQLALLGLGAVVMVSVIAYNKLQEHRFNLRRARKESASAPGAPPSAGDAGLSDITLPPQNQPPVEHHLGLEESEASDVAALINGAARVLDHRLDYVATLSFVATHLGEEVLRRSDDLVRTSKRIEWEGFSEASHAWEAIVPAAAYRRVRAGLQLVDRGGVATEAEVLSFCHGLQGLAATLVAELEFPSRSEALKGATELDRQLGELDIQVGLNVVKIGGAAIPAVAIRQAAQRVGARLQPDGRFCLTRDDGAEIFTLANLEPRPFAADNGSSTRGVTVAMDVPRSPDSDEAFRQFVSFARELAAALEADLVDDNRRPISETALATIGAEVVRVRGRLAELGVQSGTPLALRVFS